MSRVRPIWEWIDRIHPPFSAGHPDTHGERGFVHSAMPVGVRSDPLPAMRFVGIMNNQDRDPKAAPDRVKLASKIRRV